MAAATPRPIRDNTHDEKALTNQLNRPNFESKGFGLRKVLRLFLFTSSVGLFPSPGCRRVNISFSKG
jgi:hypothetical protein